MKNKIRDYLAIVMNLHFVNPPRSQTTHKRTAINQRKRRKTGAKYVRYLVVSCALIFLCSMANVVYTSAKCTDLSKRLEKCQALLYDTQYDLLSLKTKVVEQDTVNAVHNSYCIDLENKCKQLWQQNQVLYESVNAIGQNTTRVKIGSGVMFKNCGAAVVTGGEVDVTMKMEK